MTTVRTELSPSLVQFPDPPEREPDDMTSFDHLAATGSVYLLTKHLGNPETTLVAGEHYLAPHPTTDLTGLHYPDLLIAFDVDPARYSASNAYVISEQGKPPDFVLEIASRKTGRIDTGVKRRNYAALGIPEYWRFDETGEFHRSRLAGDRLVDGAYTPVEISEQADGALQGYSAVLDLHLRWESGQLGWHDPATGRRIVTFDDLQLRAEQAEARVREAQARAEEAEAQVRQLESQLRQLRRNGESDRGPSELR